MSANIVSYNDYVAGWLDSSVHDFLEVISPGGGAASYALITCLDSNPNPASLRKKGPELKAVASRARVLGRGLLLRTDLLLDANARGRVFFGFDEVWFFPTDAVLPKPGSATLVGPARMDQAKLDQLGEWMSACSCSLALGDGEGLNFIVPAQGLARYLLGHSLRQSEPAVTPFETETADQAPPPAARSRR